MVPKIEELIDHLFDKIKEETNPEEAVLWSQAAANLVWFTLEGKQALMKQ